MIHRRTVIAAVMAIMALGCALSAVAQDVAEKEVPAEKTAEQLAMEEAEKAGQQAQKLYEAGKVEEAVDLLWRTAGALPPGRPAEELRNYALMIRLQKFLEDGKNLGGVEKTIAEATELRTTAPKEWALMDAASLYVMVGNYDRAKKTFQKIFKEYGPPTKEELAEFSTEMEKQYGPPPEGIDIAQFHPRSRLRKEVNRNLDQLALIGKPAPAFELTSLDGQKVSPSTYQGTILLLDFWGTWCGPCLEELPSLKKVYAKHGGRGFEILGLSSDEEKKPLAKFVKDEEMTWKQVFLGEDSLKLFEAYKTGSVHPSSCLIDRQGVVRAIQLRGAVLGLKLEALLKAEKAGKTE